MLSLAHHQCVSFPMLNLLRASLAGRRQPKRGQWTTTHSNRCHWSSIFTVPSCGVFISLSHSRSCDESTRRKGRVQQQKQLGLESSIPSSPRLGKTQHSITLRARVLPHPEPGSPAIAPLARSNHSLFATKGSILLARCRRLLAGIASFPPRYEIRSSTPRF